MMKLDVPAPWPRQRARPSASATPSGTAMSTSAPASLKLCASAWRKLGSFMTESDGSQVYHRSENPDQIVRERVSLNENWMAMMTGTIAQTMYPQVIRTRKRGRPQGFVIQPWVRRQSDAVGTGAVGRAASLIRTRGSWLPGRR